MVEPLHLSQDDWRSRWLVLPRWGVLHRIATIEWDEPDEKISGNGATLCGRTGRLNMPGILSRMGLKRCPKCCRLMGVPQGDGNPYNEGILEPGDGPPPSQEEVDERMKAAIAKTNQ